MILHNYQPSLAEVRSQLASWGYRLAKTGDELEAYPKGKRGALSYFSTDRSDVIAAVRAAALLSFKNSLIELRIPEATKAALVEWYAYHKNKWRDNLVFVAWCSGRYDGFSRSDVASTLQQLRNTNGHAIVAMLKS